MLVHGHVFITESSRVVDRDKVALVILITSLLCCIAKVRSFQLSNSSHTFALNEVSTVKDGNPGELPDWERGSWLVITIIGIINIEHRNCKPLCVEPVCDLSNCLHIWHNIHLPHMEIVWVLFVPYYPQ